MMILMAVLFLAVAALGAGFVAVPYLRTRSKSGEGSRVLFAGIWGLVVLILGLGAYGILGRPEFALRSLNGFDNEDYLGMVATLARQIRDRPNDVQGWNILGQGYLAFGNIDEAEKAFARAAALARMQPGVGSADVFANYASLLVFRNGAVTAQAEGLFLDALAADPTHTEARYYLGFAHTARGENEEALRLWEGLIAEAPADAPWRQSLIMQSAALRGDAPSPDQSGVPDIPAMVARLAARLEVEPDDLEGWVMLIRAYVVLGDTDKAMAALTTGRDVFAGDSAAEAALTEAARANALE